jgi:hypothetical protein
VLALQWAFLLLSLHVNKYQLIIIIIIIIIIIKVDFKVNNILFTKSHLEPFPRRPFRHVAEIGLEV